MSGITPGASEQRIADEQLLLACSLNMRLRKKVTWMRGARYAKVLPLPAWSATSREVRPKSMACKDDQG